MKSSLGGIARIASAAAVSVLGLTLLAPVPANAVQAGTCTLKWKYDDKPIVNLTLNCPPRNPGQDLLWKVNLWADDRFDDDLIRSYRPNCAPLDPITWGIDENDLDEDFADRDEVYAGVWYKRPDGSTYGIQTNTISSLWGAVFGAPRITPERNEPHCA